MKLFSLVPNLLICALIAAAQPAPIPPQPIIDSASSYGCDDYRKAIAKTYGAQEDLIYFVGENRMQAFAAYLSKAGYTYFWGVFQNDSSMMVPVADLGAMPGCRGRVDGNISYALDSGHATFAPSSELTDFGIHSCRPLSELVNTHGKLTILLIVHSKLSQQFKRDFAAIRKIVEAHPEKARIVWLALDSTCD